MEAVPFQPFDKDAATKQHRRYLPHWQQDGCTAFITFRLADSLPQEKLQNWLADRTTWLQARGLADPEDVLNLSATEQREYYNQFGNRINAWLDAGHGSCALATSDVAKVIAGALTYFDGARYALGDFVVMPNHVHLSVRALPGFEVPKIVQSWKTYSAKETNRILERTGAFWMPEYFCHLVRSEQQFAWFKRYIVENPRKAGLNKGTYLLGKGSL